MYPASHNWIISEAGLGYNVSPVYTLTCISKGQGYFKTLILLLLFKKWTVISYYAIPSFCPYFPNCLINKFLLIVSLNGDPDEAHVLHLVEMFKSFYLNTLVFSWKFLSKETGSSRVSHYLDFTDHISVVSFTCYFVSSVSIKLIIWSTGLIRFGEDGDKSLSDMVLYMSTRKPSV